MERWTTRARAIAMDVMRSPWVHHVGPTSDALHRYCHATTGESAQGWDPPVTMFEDHARACWAASGVQHLRAAVTRLHHDGPCWRADLDVHRPEPAEGDAPHPGGGGRPSDRHEMLDPCGSFAADLVVVAVGLDPHRRAGLGGAPLPDRPLRSHTGRVAVLGAGHTGASAAACLAGRGTPVDLFAPGGLVTCSTDVEPGWLGPKYLRGFAALPPEARRVALRDARLGTTTPATAARLREQEQAGLVRLLPERATALEVGDGRLRVATARSHGPYAEVYEATGYRVDVKHLPWLAPHVPRACEGLPVLDHDLRAAPGLHLLGPLAELELGPAGRNLWGATRAAERLSAAVGHRGHPKHVDGRGLVAV